jgi:hypothetical protein
MSDEKEVKIIIPKGETILAQYCIKGVPTHIITSTISREIHFIYSYIDGVLTKIEEHPNPLTFEKWRK